MQHSALRGNNESVTVFTHTDVSPVTIDIYCLDDSNNFTKLSSPSVVHIVDDFYKATFTTPAINCWLCIVFGEEPIVVRAGNPDNKFIWYTGLSGQPLGSPELLKYKRISTTGSILQTGTLIEATLGSPLADPGYYYFVPSDDDESIIQIDDEEPFLYRPPYTTVGAQKGTILLQAGKWQLIAIPVKYGYWDTSVSPAQINDDGVTEARVNEYVVEQLEDKYGIGVVESANTYFGDIDMFYNFIPGTTVPGSPAGSPLSSPYTPNPHNFELTRTDGIHEEVTGFWIKSAHGSDMILEWGEP